MFISYILRSLFLYLCICVTYFTSGLLINFVQCILYIFLRPICKYLYRKINYYLCYTLFAQMIFWVDWYTSSEIYIHIKPSDWEKFGKEHAYIILNHRYEIDWLMLGTICCKVHTLGNFKAYTKKSLQYIPSIGWCTKFAEYVFLERNFRKDKDIIRKSITELVNHPDPIWLMMFPEGTRFTPEKYQASVKYANENGLPALKHHLTPRTKGFIASLHPMKNKMGAIYDVTISFNPNDKVKPTLSNLLFGKKVRAYFYIRRYDFSIIPRDEIAAHRFIHELFIRKDRLQDSFFKTGDYFDDSGLERIESFKLPRSYGTLINTVIWYLVILVPMNYYLINQLINGNILYLSIGFGILLIFFYLLRKGIDFTQISKGSAYGKKLEKNKDL